jgi:hypothetical protein
MMTPETQVIPIRARVIAGSLLSLSLAMFSPMEKTPAAAQTTSPHPFRIQISKATDDPIMPGQPIVLRWKVSDTASQDTVIRPNYEGKSWLRDITLSSTSGRRVPVVNKSFVPAPLVYGGDRGMRVVPGGYQSGFVVLRPEWPENASPGLYTLNMTVRLAYGRHSTALRVAEQVVSLPVRVVPLVPEKMHALAESLSRDLYRTGYSGDNSAGTRESAITELFALPERYAGEILQRVVTSATPPESIAADHFLNQMILMRSPAAAGQFTSMWRKSVQTGKSQDWRALYGMIGLTKMYAIADPKLRTYIAARFTEITGKAAPISFLEQGRLPVTFPD